MVSVFSTRGSFIGDCGICSTCINFWHRQNLVVYVNEMHVRRYNHNAERGSSFALQHDQNSREYQCLKPVYEWYGIFCSRRNALLNILSSSKRLEIPRHCAHASNAQMSQDGVCSFTDTSTRTSSRFLWIIQGFLCVTSIAQASRG